MKKITIGTFQKICTLLLAFCFFQTASAQSWQETESGAAQDMSIGPSEEVWITTKRNEIMRWKNDHFEKVSGSAKRISVGADGDVWIVTPAGGVAHFDPENNTWVKVAGSATDIGACVSGSVWAIGTKPADGGYEILRWNETEWEVIPGGALRVDVDDQGHPWFVNKAHTVFTLDEEYHVINKGDNLQDVSVDAHGHIWGTTTNNEIMKFENDHWEPHPGNAICATSSWEGYPWAINEQGKVMWYNASGADAATEAEPEAPVEDEVTKETTVKETSTAAVAPTKPAKPAPKKEDSNTTVAEQKEGEVVFDNVGDKPVEVYRSSSNKIGELVESIRPKSKVNIPANIGDQFEVKIAGEEFGSHPKIYITGFDENQIIYGNSPISKMPGYVAENFVMLDYQSNQFGIDLTTFNPRNLVSSINKKQVFEPLNIAEGIDYRVLGDGKIMKHGFSYAGTNLSEGSNEVTMSFGYSSFSKNWSLSVGGSGKIPVKGKVDVSPSLDFTYSEKEMMDRSSESTYAYSREQKSIFTVSVDPRKAQLDPEFKQAVLKVKDLNSAKYFVSQYGTHYAKTIYYGGDRSVYAIFNKEQYSNAKSLGIDLKASVGVSKTEKDAVVSKKTTGNSTTTKQKDQSSDIGEGRLGFSYEQGSKQESVFEKAVSKYRMIGGSGGFDNWDVSESNAAPVSAELDLIYNLITPQIFKDGTNEQLLSKAQFLIETAVSLKLESMPLLKKPLPPPNAYAVTIDKLEVIEEIDDANKNTKGNISLEMIYQDKNGQTISSKSSDNFWSIPDFSLDFKFTKGNIIFPNATYRMVDFPDSSTGNFKKLLFNVKGSIQEKDDILWDNNDEMNGETGRINIAELNLSPGQATTAKTFDLVFNEGARSNRIRVSYTIRREPSEFNDPLF